MECPHCKQELPALPCATCGQKALPGAAFCHHCGHELPAPEGEPPKLLTCASCGQSSPPQAKYCAECGEPLQVFDAEGGLEGLDLSQRTACSDGSCIGIIGPEGKCTECGKPYTGPA
ncbi:MAG: zinc ribbon domain-containing protein [Thermodesulfobacteriota bacterium]